MAGPFRHGPPELPAAHVSRDRLLARVDRRWSCRLVTLVAGPGFGKTSLLSEATIRGRRRAGDRDVWLTCEPADRTAATLMEGLTASMGLGVTTFDGLVRAVWHVAPAHVCFVLDDVHELGDRSEGAEFVARLVAELPRNGHVVMSSRSRPPLPLAPLAAKGRLERIEEDDLLFTEDEIEHFAETRRVDGTMLAATGGWPALLELSASAGDLVDDYLWGEVLGRIGDDRAHALAVLGAVGAADDEVAADVLGARSSLRDLLADIPLVSWTAGAGGSTWATLHALWEPVLRPRRSTAEAAHARQIAARVHRRRGRLDAAIELLARAGAWDEVLATIREAGIAARSFEEWHHFARWRALLPDRMHNQPVARLAAGIEIAARVPVDAMSEFELAAAGFREAGDADGELAALGKHAIVAWWANDIGALFGVIERGRQLAADGHTAAQVAARVGDAAIAHATAQPSAVLEALAPVQLTDAGEWAPSVGWLRAVAHRRLGDLERAEQAALAASRLVHGDVQLDVARARADWLRGHVDDVPEVMRRAADHYRAAEHRYLWVEATLERAARLAWLGDRNEARQLLDAVAPHRAAAPGALAAVLWTIASASLCIGVGDEPTAASMLASEPLARPGTTNSWYWVDRAAVSLPHVLCPDDRKGWVHEVVAPVHRVGLELSVALESARVGDDGPVRRLTWPTPGSARAHLPAAWLAELAAAGFRAGNPPPPELVDRLLASGHSPVTGAAQGANAARAEAMLEVLASGPVELRRDGQLVEHADLRRRRVRELVAVLVLLRAQRREEVADLLFADSADPRHNLRVTIGYLRRAIGNHPALIVDHERVRLVPSPWFRCDLWELDELLESAAAAERDGTPERALERYGMVLPLWRGAPFADLGDVDWVRDEQTRRRARFVDAAVRAGELHLASGAFRAAVDAGERAVEADRYAERAHRVVLAALMADGDVSRARDAAERCVVALAELEVTPADETAALIGSVAASR